MRDRPGRASWWRARTIVLAVLGSLLLAVFYGFVVEPDRLTLRSTEIALAGWPPRLAGLRIAVFADLHAGAPFIDLDKVRRVVDLTNDTQPDLILLPGDFVIQGVPGGHFMEPTRFAGELKRLKARHGVFATLGNHDWWHDQAQISQVLESAGIRVLENRAVRIDLDKGAIWLAGLSDDWAGKPDIAGTLRQVTDDAPIIVITHNPDLFPALPSRVALTVAGHTHGGQVVLPLIGRPIVPSRYGQRYAIGHVVEDGRHLFVTPGIGTSILPVRFGVPPEVSLLTIK